MKAPNTAPLLTKLLEKQHETRSPGLFRSGVFTLPWRCKVGSFPAPDSEMLISAGEPCGRWDRQSDFAEVGDRPFQLPLNGYLPGSSIRGVVRAWAMQQADLRDRAIELLGNQTDDTISSGKIEFLDAWPAEPTRLALDITNPQQRFQVYHDPEEQGNPSPIYTLGNGHNPVKVTISIRGIPKTRVQSNEIDEVWGWVQQALNFHGVGSRTASGYGRVESAQRTNPWLPEDYETKEIIFHLYSQGCHGPSNKNELRPSHWRGWLRSWTLRFLLGVMSEKDAHLTLEELFGVLESIEDKKSRKGEIRLNLLKGLDELPWGKVSADVPEFYAWKGKIRISAPQELLESLILPIIRFAVSAGGVGRGWRRPLHIFMMEFKDKKTGEKLKKPASRGTYLTLLHRREDKLKSFALSPEPKVWQNTYQRWQKYVQTHYPDRYRSEPQNLEAEVFSLQTCAVYLVDGSPQEPLDKKNLKWAISSAPDTRGSGMGLIYDPQYKRNIQVGGRAAQGGRERSYCSWVTIRRIPAQDTGTKEVVCLFMGGQAPGNKHLRSQFLKDLHNLPGRQHLFGVQPPATSEVENE